MDNLATITTVKIGNKKKQIHDNNNNSNYERNGDGNNDNDNFFKTSHGFYL